MQPYLQDVLWVVILGFLLAFILAFGVGANDVANSFATSIGSGVLTFRQACYLASFFEIAGAVLLGYKVSDTMRKGIWDVNEYVGNEQQLMVGMLSALAGCAIWLLIATWMKLPVSTTHSIVGATVGFGLVSNGTEGLNVKGLAVIALSWIISPVLSGLVSAAFLKIVYSIILNRRRPFRAATIALPFVYALTVFVNVLSITLDGSKLLMLDDLPTWLVFVISIAAAFVMALIAKFVIGPWQLKKILSEHSDEDPTPKPVSDVNEIETEANVNQLFNFLQVLSAIFGSFAHGGNDVSNAVGPLVAIWLIYTEGSVLAKSESPIWILFYGGVGIAIGLWCFGKRVVNTIGRSLTRITPATGFVIETGAAMTVLVASKLGIPISTTHCKVGSVVCVGWAYGRITNEEGNFVDWSLFKKIAMAWVVTLPISAGFSAFFMWFISLQSNLLVNALVE